MGSSTTIEAWIDRALLDILRAYRDDLTDYTDGFTSSVGEEVTSDGQNFAIHFVWPSSIVAKNGDAVWNIDVVGIFERFAIVQRFQGGNVGSVAFD